MSFARRMLGERLRDEGGTALIVALCTMVIVSIGAVAAVQLSTSNMQQASWTRADAKALSVAEAGLAHALAVLAGMADPTAVSTLSSAGSILFEDGSYTYSGSRSGMVWTLEATGTVANPTGAMGRSRTVSAQAQISGGTPVGGAWEYVFLENPSGCFTIENSVTISAPLYVDGDFCLKNTAQHIGPLLDVAGNIQTDGTAAVGSTASPVPLVRVGGGCRNGSSGSFVTPCGPSQRVWAGIFTTTAPAVTKPSIDLDHWYANSKPGPQRYCTSGSFPGGSSAFDNDGIRNGSAGSLNLLAPTSYDCTVVDGGVVVGRIAWTVGEPGTLTVQGVVFFDGSLVMNTNTHAVYSGRGTIYASGPIVFDGTTSICVNSDCSGEWDPNESAIVFVSGSTSTAAIDVMNQSKVQAAVYAVGGFRIANNAMFSGPVVADGATATNSGLLGGWVPFNAPVTGMPTSDSEGAPPLQVTLVPSSWRS